MLGSMRGSVLYAFIIGWFSVWIVIFWFVNSEYTRSDDEEELMTDDRRQQLCGYTVPPASPPATQKNGQRQQKACTICGNIIMARETGPRICALGNGHGSTCGFQACSPSCIFTR